MKTKKELLELRGLEVSALSKKLNETEEELMKLRFKHASSQLEKTATLRQLRRKVAQIRTVQRESVQKQSA